MGRSRHRMPQETYKTGEQESAASWGSNRDNNAEIVDSYATGNVDGGGSVGGLVGQNAGSITASHATGDVTASGSSGGLFGTNFGGFIDKSYATGDVWAEDGTAGGFGGNHRDHGVVQSSYATGEVTGGESSNDLGGLLGSTTWAEVRESYATGSVEGGDFVGGLIGYAWGAIVENCYSLSSVMGANRVGGLIGWRGYDEWDHDQGSIVNSYAAGTITATGDYVGGLIGDYYFETPQELTEAFWDKATTGIDSDSDAVGNIAGIGGATGLNTSEFDEQSTFDNGAGWDFDSIWQMGTSPAPDGEERPVLKWQLE